MGSSRLPGKVLLDLAGQPMLRRVVERTRLAKTIDQVVVATTSEPSDDPIVELCARLGYACTAAAFTMCWTAITRLPGSSRQAISCASRRIAR